MMMQAIIRRELNRRRYCIPFHWSPAGNCVEARLAFSNGANAPARKDASTAKNESSKIQPDTIEKNPYYAKYREQLTKKIEEVNTTGSSAIRRNETSEEKLNIHKTGGIKREAREASSSESGDQVERPSKVEHQRGHSLAEIVRLDVLRQKTPNEIESIWRQYHQDKDFVYAVIPGSNYDVMHAKAKQFPLFVYPLPRVEKGTEANKSSSMEFIFGQFNGHQIHMTPLIMYQQKKEYAPSCLTITHYAELQQEKGLVLMRGEFDTDVINCMEAQCLANQIQLFYGDQTGDGKRSRLLSQFNREPHKFSYMELINEFKESLLA